MNEDILKYNPHSDSSDMPSATESIELSAEFASGEIISIKSNYGLIIKEETLEEILTLLLLA